MKLKEFADEYANILRKSKIKYDNKLNLEVRKGWRVVNAVWDNPACWDREISSAMAKGIKGCFKIVE